MTQFSEAETDALASAVALASAGVGFVIDQDRVEDLATCRGLCESGHLEAVEGVPGGFILSREFAAALAQDVKRTAEAAEQN
jgi:hypothetical protein